MKNKIVIVLVCVVAAVIAAGWYFMSRKGVGDSGKEETRQAARPTETGRKPASAVGDGVSKASASTNRVARKRGKMGQFPLVRKDKGDRPQRVAVDEFDDPEHPYSAEDRKISIELQDALDNVETPDEEDVKDRQANGKRAGVSRAAAARKRMMAAAAKAAASSNPAVRQRAVEAYSWMGNDALPEMTPMMADADPEVAEMAIDKVENALNEITDPAEQFLLSASYLNSFSANEDAMTMLSGIMEGAASSMIEPSSESATAQQKAKDNRSQVVEALATMISKGGKLAETAKESYNTITSADWVNADEARLWAADPDSYEPPEPPDDPEPVGAEEESLGGGDAT